MTKTMVALALGVAQAVHHAAPIARALDPEADVTGFAGNLGCLQKKKPLHFTCDHISHCEHLGPCKLVQLVVF